MSLKIAICQINSTVGDFLGNSKKILKFHSDALSYGADLSVFPEMSLCGYPPEDLLLRDNFIKKNGLTLIELSKQVTKGSILLGFVHKAKGKVLNSAALLGYGNILSTYGKRDLPNYGVFDEKRYFSPGESSGLFTVNGVKLGISICEDIWTEGSGNVLYSQAKSGARVLINISASPFHAGKFNMRLDLLRKRVRQCKCPILYVNLVGGQDELVFDGRSFLVDINGRLITRAKSFEEDLKIVEISPISRSKILIKSREPQEDLHEGVAEIYRALCLGVKDYVEKNGFKSVILGLSGGIDSALTAAIAKDALGSDRVVGVTMPSPYTSSATLQDSLDLAKNLGIIILTIPITPIFDSYLKCLSEIFGERPEDITEENLQSRIRGTLLMALSNKFGHLVLTTGNKSELSVGYCTLYGDTAGGFAVIKDVPKTMVYQLSEYVNLMAGFSVIPRSTIERAPTAELKENQKDQDTLPPYDILDGIIKGYVEEDLGIESLLRKGFDITLLKRILRMIDKNEYKRRQSPPGVKITPKSFGKDRRMPITNSAIEI